MLVEERCQRLKDFMSSLSKEERTKLLMEARILDEYGHLQEKEESKKETVASKDS